MSRRKRLEVVTLEASPQLEVVRVVDIHVRSLSSRHHFDGTSQHICNQDRLYTMQAERLNTCLAIGPADSINRGPGNQRTGNRQDSKAGCRRTEEPVLLSARILQSRCNLAI